MSKYASEVPPPFYFISRWDQERGGEISAQRDFFLKLQLENVNPVVLLCLIILKPDWTWFMISWLPVGDFLGYSPNTGKHLYYTWAKSFKTSCWLCFPQLWVIWGFPWVTVQCTVEIQCLDKWHRTSNKTPQTPSHAMQNHATLAEILAWSSKAVLKLPCYSSPGEGRLEA